MLTVHLDELGELLLLDLDVDERVAVVVKNAEKPVDAHVDARGLEERRRRRGRSRFGPRRGSGKSSRRRGPRRRLYGLRSWTLVAIASDIDRSELRRHRRELRRRQVRRRRLTATRAPRRARRRGALRPRRSSSPARRGAAIVVLEPVRSAMPASPFRSTLPDEIRGVHVTGPLMSLPGKFQQYLALKKDGLNTLEVDVKDESGNVSFHQRRARDRGEGRRRARVFQREGRCSPGAQGGHLPDRSSRQLRGPDHGGRAPSDGDSQERRIALAH